MQPSEQCEPGLVFWLVEELLDSQTIDGCRSIFDFLDSRRERMTAVSGNHGLPRGPPTDGTDVCRNILKRKNL